MGAEFVRGRVCQGPSLLGAEMSRNPRSVPLETRVKMSGLVNNFLCRLIRAV